jgi:hypothetical protein
MIHRLVATAVLASAATLPAHAVTVTQWNFNSPTPDANTGSGTVLPSVGSGTATLLGGTTATFASGDASGGSSDPATGDDSGWNVTAFAAQGTGDKTRGAQFAVSTVGQQDITIQYDLRHSNTSSSWEQVQVTVDGTTWIDVASFSLAAGDTWANGRTVDLSAIGAVDNNASFAFRVLATFAPGSSGYVASSPTGTYGSTGTWRFDQVTVSAVPEPASTTMLLAGLAALGFMARRRAA